MYFSYISFALRLSLRIYKSFNLSLLGQMIYDVLNFDKP